MKESIGGSWLFGIIIAFMMIFVGYLVIMINYSTAFKLKNEVVHMIEKYEGLSSSGTGSVKLINNYLKNSKYGAKGPCECPADSRGCYGATDLNSASLTPINVGQTSTGNYYCVQFYSTVDGGNSSTQNTGYYDVQLFLNFNLPVLGKIAKFSIKGQTIKMKYPVGWKDDFKGYK